jgi:hypothetical protein
VQPDSPSRTSLRRRCYDSNFVRFTIAPTINPVDSKGSLLGIHIRAERLANLLKHFFMLGFLLLNGGCTTKYTPVLTFGLHSGNDHMETWMIDNLHPSYRLCSKGEIFMSRPGQFVFDWNASQRQAAECSAILRHCDGSINFVFWEIPENVIPEPGPKNMEHDFSDRGVYSNVAERTAKKYNTEVWDEDCRPTPTPPVQLHAATVEHIRSSVAHPWDVLPDLQGVLRHVFGSNVGKFELATNGPGELTINGEEAFFHFCKAHACPDHEGALVINLTNGKSAGAIVDEGSVYTYECDYPTKDALPEALQAWLKENTQQ